MNNYKKLTIKEWALEDRPREKIISQGIKSLSPAELLSVIIGSGTRTASAVELSKNILKSVNNNIDELARRDLNQLQKIPGIGPARALSILAAFELSTRRNSHAAHPRKKIGGSKDVFEIFHPLLKDLAYEEFWILLINRANLVLDKSKISQGGISGTVIDTRIILKKAVDKLSSSLILCHNHPSGNLKPSEADIRITEKIKKSGEIMDINLLDHLIIADNSYFSFADEGLI
ncbi:MAG: DNA repair protein RadC [Bacteroidales bacterium]|nr:DNA repair protein RadC [Bacteroidales bacterium]